LIFLIEFIDATAYMRLLKFIILPLIAFILTGCPWYGYRYPEGKLPKDPVNLEDFNTEYDDYNSTAPSLGELVPFCYSTNRHSQGGEFDIKFEPMDVNWDKSAGELTVNNEYGSWSTFADTYGPLMQLVRNINSTGDELGPNLLYSPHPEFADADFVLLYATDLDGNFDINFTYNLGYSVFSDGAPVSYLNSSYNDLYPSFNSDFSRIYFCSDREDGVFNIFYTDVSYSNSEMVALLSDTLDYVVELDAVLSSDYEDKCPYLFGNTLVFTSNRPGGSGGYDLYYSIYESGAWGEPVNFGPEINTASDEYRPILFDPGVDYERNMMIFSSNRSGGEGGFDLYFAGILKDL
jgi:hypothetical protein